MTAAALVAEARARGVELSPTPEGKLRVRPVSRLTPELLDALREHKPAILALLTPPGAPRAPSSWPATLTGHLGRPGAYTDCDVCAVEPRTDELTRYGPEPVPLGTFRVYGMVPLCRAHAVGPGALVVAYHDACRRCWALIAAGPDACRRALDDAVRLTDDVGALLALRLRRRWGRAWWVETGWCPTCGESGELHEPAPRWNERDEHA